MQPLLAFFFVFLLALAAQPLFGQGTTYEGPVGVTGIFNGNISTGCSYDPLTHSEHRAVDDIVVPGSVGKYPLKMTRYYNSRQQYYATAGAIGLSPGWAHEYSWLLWTAGHKVVSPHGSVSDDSCGTSVGVSEGWEGTHDSASGTWRLADGGKVVFNGDNQHPAQVTDIYDPHGLRTRIAYDATGQRVKVTEPGGRCLWFTYGNQEPADGTRLLTLVQAYDVDGSPGSPTSPTGHVIDWVSYAYTSVFAGSYDINGQPINKMMLTGVTYSDGTSAAYTYTTDNVTQNPPTSIKLYPLVQRCDDVRYNGPMRTIFYDYQNGGPHGVIIDEKYPGVGNVSAIGPVLPTGNQGIPDTFTETRGDGLTRTFTYTHLVPCIGDDCSGPCAAYGESEPHNKMLTNYTDFQNHKTYLGYNGDWYINHVTDARGLLDGDPNYTTYYTRGPSPSATPTMGIGQITQIKHPDGTHIDYTYQLETGAIGGHYMATVSDERGNQTVYTRDPVTHLVTRIDYPDASYEEFLQYNSFGQFTVHHLRNGAWESFVYDGRGLLTDKYNPKFDTQSQAPGGTDPHTHYDYYLANDPIGGNDWIDRVKTVTLPPNRNGFSATETYEYDKNSGGTHVPGRGLVTKITHTDGTYQSFGYDAYGNKLWQEDELRDHTSHIYDSYNRGTSTTDPLQHTESFSYLKPGASSSYLHTTDSVYTYTSRAGIVTTNVYDENFRKTSSSVAGFTTWFQYDNVGNQTYVTDPRGTATPGPYTTYTDYDSRNRKSQVRAPLNYTTQFFYEDGINMTRIIRAVGTSEANTETKTYDAMNRVLSDAVQKTTSTSLTTWFTYNPSGTIWKVTDPRGSSQGDPTYTTLLYYDASDRKIKMTYPGGGSNQQWSYDDAGNLKNRTTVNNETQLFYYDNRNRNNGTSWSNSNNVVDWRYFGHDAASRLVEAENGTWGWGTNVISDVQRSYDAASRLTQEKQNLFGVYPVYVNYPSYDDDGRLKQMNVGGVSYDFTYSYDAAGRFEKIFVTNGQQLFQYIYDAASNEIERDNILTQVDQSYPRDALNRMLNMSVTKGTTTLANETYGYDGMNRITGVTYDTGAPDSFHYYLDGELNTATVGYTSHTLTYNFDNKGNRTSVTDTANPTVSYTPNPIDQYTSVSGSSITNGSEHEISSFNGVPYSYINDERLHSATSGSTIYSMVYDALGRCVLRTLQNPQGSLRPTPTPRATPTPPQSPTPTPTPGGSTTYYFYDGEKPILEYDATSGTSVGVNLYGKGIDEIVERVAIGADGYTYVYYPQQNHEGSVTLLTDGSSAPIERYRYDAFGTPTFYDGNWNPQFEAATFYDNRFLFTGREYAATYRSFYTTPGFNFYEYRARAYNPTLGRFMSEDPKLFDAGDYNLFRYCHNDPLDFTDPMGLWDFEANQYGSIRDWEMTKSYLSRDPVMRDIIAKGEHLHIRVKPNNQNITQIRRTGPTVIDYDPHSGIRTTEGGRQSPALGAGHEMDHAVRRETDRKAYDFDRLPRSDKQYGNREERRVIEGSEAHAAETLGEDRRFDHTYKSFFRTDSPTSRDSNSNQPQRQQQQRQPTFESPGTMFSIQLVH